LGRYVFTNGKIYTASGRRPFCQALAVLGKRVLLAGSEAEIDAVVDDSFERIDLKGRALIPAFSDSHIHFMFFSLGMSGVDLDGAASVEDAAARVAKAVEAAKPGTWVLGSGWNKNAWPGGELPDRSYLDAVAPKNPVAMFSKDLHLVWVNTAALRLAGVGIDTPDPEGGEIVRDEETRQATGILKEAAADLVRRVIPEPTSEATAAAMEKGMAQLHAFGIAAIHNMEGASAFQAFQLLRNSGRLKLRVTSAIAKENLDDALDMGLSTGFGDEWLRIGPLKIFADGALGSQTAHLLRPYEGNPRNTGIAVTSKEEIAELVGRAVLGGISCAVHAIGDRANREVLSIFESVREESGRRRLRHRIEHAQLLHPDDVRKFADVGVVASMQPVHILTDIPAADRHWGKRSRWTYAFRSLIKSGATLAFGSDAPVETPNPIHGIYAAVARRRLDGTPDAGWYPEERLTVEETVRAYTAGAAAAVGEELTRGTLSRGSLADIAVLSRDIFSMPAAEIPEAHVVATMVGGEFVFRKDL
jgi:predicted amidohydrolase YtcJ